MKSTGPLFALLSAMLFGLSPVLIKATAGEMAPVLMAGLLYLGSGIGLFAYSFIRKISFSVELQRLPSTQRLKLIGAIVTGGVLAPLMLTYGIQRGTAFEVSSLLNLETVATTIIAAWIFHEHVSRRVWLGKVLIVLGALLIGLRYGTTISFSSSSVLIIGACTLWGIDNNLTRDVEVLSPSVLAGLKGMSAGLFNLLLALVLGNVQATHTQVFSVMMIGALSYGVSLVFFVYALRLIGSSRTSTYFAVGPFVGMMAAVLFLGEQPTSFQWIASALMVLGVWALYRERHEHLHVHEPMSHSHMHVHDEHHQHEHNGTEGPEPHEHFHEHKALTHSHAHLPDIHHRHRH